MTGSVARRALADFNAGDAFFDHLSDDVVLEFPYGPSLGLPARVVGLQPVRERLGAAQASGLTLSATMIHDASPGRCFAEYTGTYRTENGREAEVPLVAAIEHDGDRITLIREYWDTLRLATMNEA